MDMSLRLFDSAKHLGVNISDYLSWETHVDKTADKASSTLGFLRRNLINCTKEKISRKVKGMPKYTNRSQPRHQEEEKNDKN